MVVDSSGGCGDKHPHGRQACAFHPVHCISTCQCLHVAVCWLYRPVVRDCFLFIQSLLLQCYLRLPQNHRNGCKSYSNQLPGACLLTYNMIAEHKLWLPIFQGVVHCLLAECLWGHQVAGPRACHVGRKGAVHRWCDGPAAAAAYLLVVCWNAVLPRAGVQPRGGRLSRSQQVHRAE